MAFLSTPNIVAVTNMRNTNDNKPLLLATKGVALQLMRDWHNITYTH